MNGLHLHLCAVCQQEYYCLAGCEEQTHDVEFEQCDEHYVDSAGESEVATYPPIKRDGEPSVKRVQR